MSKEKTFKRDMTFNVNRHRYGDNIPATDIDFLEYDRWVPVLLWEAKSTRSGWQSGVRTHSMVAQSRLAWRAGIRYAVVEHNDTWSEITVFTLLGWRKRKGRWLPVMLNAEKHGLRSFVKWLYEIRGRCIERELGSSSVFFPDKSWEDCIPIELTPVIFQYRG